MFVVWPQLFYRRQLGITAILLTTWTWGAKLHNPLGVKCVYQLINHPTGVPYQTGDRIHTLDLILTPIFSVLFHLAHWLTALLICPSTNWILFLTRSAKPWRTISVFRSPAVFLLRKTKSKDQLFHELSGVTLFRVFYFEVWLVHRRPVCVQ